MSKKIFINNLNTTVAEAILNELQSKPDEDGNMPSDPNLIYGTYISKDSSIKPNGVTKMLKVSQALVAVTFLCTEVETTTCKQIHFEVRLDRLRPSCWQSS
jgi:hypothetical protein